MIIPLLQHPPEPSGYGVTIRYGGLSKDPVRVTLTEGRKKEGGKGCQKRWRLGRHECRRAVASASWFPRCSKRPVTMSCPHAEPGGRAPGPRWPGGLLGDRQAAPTWRRVSVSKSENFPFAGAFVSGHSQRGSFIKHWEAGAATTADAGKTGLGERQVRFINIQYLAIAYVGLGIYQGI